MRRVSILLLLLFTGTVLFAQPGGQYLFSHLDAKDGLLSNNVLSIQQDKKGYMWIGTTEGLQRYDGYRFVSFRHNLKRPASLPEGAVHILQLDKKNRLWILLDQFKIGYVTTDDLMFHEMELPVSQEIKERSHGDMIVDNAGNIMVVIVGYGIFTYNETGNKFSLETNLFHLPAQWKPLYIWQDKTNNYWIGCDSGLVKFNTVKQTLSYRSHNIDKDPVIEKMGDLTTVILAYIDNTNRFWIKSWPLTGLQIKSYTYSSGKLMVWQDIIGRAVQSRYYELHGVADMSDKSIWLAGHNLFAKLTPDQNNVEAIISNLPGEYSIRYDIVNRLFEDHEKNIWICTDKGLFRFNPTAQMFKPALLRVPGKDTVYSPDVNDIIQTKSGVILAATWGNGIFSFDNNFKPIQTSIASQSLRTNEGMAWRLHERANGDIWRADQGGIIFIYHPSTNSTERIQHPIFEKSTIRQITEDKKGNLWFGTQNGYLIKWDAVTNRFSLIQKLQSIISKLITDANGNIWASTQVKGVFKINSDNGRIISNYTAAGDEGKRLRANSISDIIQYDDSLFIIAANGINVLNIKNDSITYVTTNDGLPTNNIFSLVKDRQGYIWIATAAGVVSLHIEKEKLSHYNPSDGVYTNSFNTASVGMLNDGRIAFGTAHDIMVFDPAQLTVHKYIPPPIEITGFSLMNALISVDSLKKQKTIELQYRQNSIAIDLSTLSYQNIFPLYYKMEGIDKEWINASGSHQAVFSYLPPGHYTFQTASKDEAGNFGPITKMFFHIRAPFWNTWWFYSLLALFFTAVLFWFDRQRMQRLKEEQQIRMSIAANLHEDVSLALENINVLSEIATMKAAKQPEQSKDFIHQIQQKSRNMVIAMNDVLWSVDPQNDSMPKTIERLHEVAHAMRNRHAKKIDILTADNVIGLKLSMKIRHELIFIYKLVMVSLVEILQSPHTAVQLDYARPLLNLKILSVTILPKFDGIVTKNMEEVKKRAQAINAVLDIQSDEKGTEITLAIKV